MSNTTLADKPPKQTPEAPEIDVKANVQITHRPRRLCLLCGKPTHERYSCLVGLLHPESCHQERFINLTIDVAICSRHFTPDVVELRRLILDSPGVRKKLEKIQTITEDEP